MLFLQLNIKCIDLITDLSVRIHKDWGFTFDWNAIGVGIGDLPLPGMRIKEAVKQTGKVDSDVIIVHAATNNVASTTPQELCKETMDTLGAIQKNNPKAKIAFSAVFRRKDSHELNSKVTQLNELLSEKLPLDGFDMIENDNILFSNLKSDGLHLNEGGVRKFAGNLNKFIKYC